MEGQPPHVVTMATKSLPTPNSCQTQCVAYHNSFFKGQCWGKSSGLTCSITPCGNHGYHYCSHTPH